MEPSLPRLDLRSKVETCTDAPMERLRRALEEAGKGVEVWCKGYADEFTITSWARKNGYRAEVLEREGDEVLLRLVASP